MEKRTMTLRKKKKMGTYGVPTALVALSCLTEVLHGNTKADAIIPVL
jgi:hypothetical protein